jgi:phosphonate transport system substrate-binding protein
MSLKSALLTLIFSCGLSIATNPAFCADSGKQKTLSFGIVPQQSASNLARNWVPLMEYLTKRTGITITFDTTADIPAFEKALSEGKYDLAYMNPYHYVIYSNAPGYTAFCRAKGKKIKGILVVHKDSHIQNMQELAGNDIAFPSPFSFAATMLPQAYFASQNIQINPVYVKSHDSVYRNIASKRIIAGGGVMRTFDAIDNSISDNLRILWTSDGYTPHAFASHPRVSSEITNAITNAFLELTEENGKTLLDNININGFERAHNGDWDDVRNLKLNLPK